MKVVPLKIENVLDWLSKFDTAPVIVPKDHTNNILGLVAVCLRKDGEIRADVLPGRQNLSQVAAPSNNVRKLFFEVPISALLKVCEGLQQSDFKETQDA